MNQPSLFSLARSCLACSNVQEKLALSVRIADAWFQGELSLDPCHDPITVGRPEKPTLVLPRELRKRGLGTPEGRAAMIHALAHIEFNAIHLAWDAACRFTDMPRAYYDDWVQVAREETYHFSLVIEHLESLGYQYGDFPAHNGLWVMVEETAHDVLTRMALVPRVLEARGLDITPGVKEKFAQLGDVRMSEILGIILRDEVGHVAVGNHWYYYLCEERGLDPLETFIQLIEQHFVGELKGPFSIPYREQAGFRDVELAWFAQMDGGRSTTQA